MRRTSYDIKNRVEKCLECGKTNFDTEARYCSECGTTLYNKCSNYSCGEVLNLDEKYCKFCGSKSLFLNAGFLSTPGNKNTDNLPF